MLLLILLLAMAAPVADLPDRPPDGRSVATSIAERYAANDVEALRAIGSGPLSVSDNLLLRYRLYPLTRDVRYLENLPDENQLRTARDLALLSALWSYRVMETRVWKMPAYARHADALLARAIATDPADPFVLLVEGQNLLYRPGIVGGSATEALERFVRLRDSLRSRDARASEGLSLMEAEVWVWYTLRKLRRSGTDQLRDRLLAQNPPPLFREFLLDPP